MGSSFRESVEQHFSDASKICPLGGQRHDLQTDGRPDPRLDVRENVAMLGDLLSDFDFSQLPRLPPNLSEHPIPGPASIL